MLNFQPEFDSESYFDYFFIFCIIIIYSECKYVNPRMYFARLFIISKH